MLMSKGVGCTVTGEELICLLLELWCCGAGRVLLLRLLTMPPFLASLDHCLKRVVRLQKTCQAGPVP